MTQEAVNEVISFWFEELDPQQHWVKDESLDRTIIRRFSALHHAAVKGELWHWRQTPHGRLAEIIVLDQFSRNMFRGESKSFAYDSIALVLAQEAVRQKADSLLPVDQKSFIYLPYMHSESLLIHEQAMILFDQPGLENNFRFEKRHKEIIERFGRYPHRNKLLNRVSSTEELAFLQEPGSAF